MHQARSLSAADVAIAAGLLAAFFAGFFLLVAVKAPAPAAADPDLAAYVQAVTEASSRLNSRLYERPVLRGEAEDGNAWTFYQRAAEAILKPFPDGLGEPGPADFEEGSDLYTYVEASREALELTRKGVQRRGCCAYVAYRDGYSANADVLFAAPALADLLAYEAARLAREKKHGEAAQVLLDAARFGQDLARGGAFHHAMVSDRVVLASLRRLARLLKGISRKSSLRRKWRDLAENEVRTLRDSFHPLAHSASSELILLTAEVVLLAKGKGYAAAGWKESVPLPDKKALLATLEKAGPLFEDFYAACPHPLANPLQAYRDAEGLDDRLDGLGDPVLDACGVKFSSHVEAHLVSHSLSAVLFHGMLFSWTWKRADRYRPADPFSGSKMKWVYSEGRLRIYSVGPDLKDDGGKAERTWHADEPDLVLQFTRK